MAYKSKRIPYRTEHEKHELIAQLMAEGYTPSAIDEELRLDKGYTHDWCRLMWAENKTRVFTKAEKVAQFKAKAKRRAYTSTQNRNQAIHRKAKQQNSVVAKRYAGRELERQNPWNK